MGLSLFIYSLCNNVSRLVYVVLSGGMINELKCMWRETVGSDLWYCPRVSCERQENYSKPADNLCPGWLMNTGQKYKLLDFVCVLVSSGRSLFAQTLRVTAATNSCNTQSLK